MCGAWPATGPASRRGRHPDLGRLRGEPAVRRDEALAAAHPAARSQNRPRRSPHLRDPACRCPGRTSARQFLQEQRGLSRWEFMLPQIFGPESAERNCGGSAGVRASEFTGRPAPCSSERRDTARTRRRDGRATRFMGREHRHALPPRHPVLFFHWKFRAAKYHPPLV